MQMKYILLAPIAGLLLGCNQQPEKTAIPLNYRY